MQRSKGRCVGLERPSAIQRGLVLNEHRQRNRQTRSDREPGHPAVDLRPLRQLPRRGGEPQRGARENCQHAQCHQRELHARAARKYALGSEQQQKARKIYR